jgi:hypothetical protein
LTTTLQFLQFFGQWPSSVGPNNLKNLGIKRRKMAVIAAVFT